VSALRKRNHVRTSSESASSQRYGSETGTPYRVSTTGRSGVGGVCPVTRPAPAAMQSSMVVQVAARASGRPGRYGMASSGERHDRSHRASPGSMRPIVSARWCTRRLSDRRTPRNDNLALR
jgi:hypothetical protein